MCDELGNNFSTLEMVWSPKISMNVLLSEVFGWNDGCNEPLGCLVEDGSFDGCNERLGWKLGWLDEEGWFDGCKEVLGCGVMVGSLDG